SPTCASRRTTSSSARAAASRSPSSASDPAASTTACAPSGRPSARSSVWASRRAAQLMVERGISREAFGKPIIQLGKNTEIVSRARIDIEAMRMMVLRAAKAMDVLGNQEARVWVHAVKAMVPERVCQIIDQAIQIHGATGVSQWSPLSAMYTGQRTLRIADGPDAGHHPVV